MSKGLTLKEAEKIVDDMYQKRWVECGIDDGNTIHMGNLDKLQYTELESASILLLRTEIRLQQENKKYKEVIDKAIKYIRIYRSYQKIDNKDYLKGRDEIGCLDICQVDELLDILKEVE